MKINSYNDISDSKLGKSMGFAKIMDKKHFTDIFWKQVKQDIKSSGRKSFKHEHEDIIKRLRLSIDRHGKISAILYKF